MTVTSRFRGFTLIELMVTLAVVAIVAAIAAPSFSDLLRQNRLTNETNNFLAVLQLARSEAVNRGVNVTIQRCGGVNNASQWEHGWQVFTDWDGDKSFDTAANTTDFCSNPEGDILTDCSQENDCLLRGYPALEDGLTLRSGNNLTTSFSFLPTGFIAPAAGDSFSFCDTQATGNNSDFSRKITINRIGNAKFVGVADSCP